MLCIMLKECYHGNGQDPDRHTLSRQTMLKKITYIAKKNHRSLNAQLEHLTQESH